MTVGNWKTHLIVECDTCKKPMGFHTEMSPKLCNTCKRINPMTHIADTTTVYCARWTDYGGGWAESRTSQKHLERHVFGQPYAPGRANVSFTTRQESQDVS